MTGISRQATALKRYAYSKPISSAIGDGIISAQKTVFDYGCGRGDDVARLKETGIQASGWDPAHKSSSAPTPSDVVNLGYVVNVIEDKDERKETLRKAWRITKEVLIVSAQLSIDAKTKNAKPFKDGYVTLRGTFQKYFEQQELREWINDTISAAPVAAAPGVFYVFRDEDTKEAYMSSRYRRRSAVPKQRAADKLFEEHKELLEGLMGFFAGRGRLPGPDEFSQTQELIGVFGSAKKAFHVIRLVTDPEQWERIADERAQDLLIYLALSRFDGRKRFSGLPSEIRLDVKAFYSNYKMACELADALLFGCGDQDLINEYCVNSGVGKLTPNALYVHVSALDELSALLRTYEGCAKAYVGLVEGSNIVKLHRREPKISYLSYPVFEKDPHPKLSASLSVNLQTFRIKQRRYGTSSNPPILHRKELFVTDGFVGKDKFARLTKSEERAGLYEDTTTIGTRDGWDGLLRTKGVKLRGHRLVKTGTIRPEQD